jgi:hypothetical protein
MTHQNGAAKVQQQMQRLVVGCRVQLVVGLMRMRMRTLGLGLVVQRRRRRSKRMQSSMMLQSGAAKEWVRCSSSHIHP